MTEHVIAPGVVVGTLNPSWNRPFAVERSLEGDGKRYYLCRFLAPNPDRTASPDFEFMLFGVVHVVEANLTKAWPIVVRKGVYAHVDLIADGEHALRGSFCPGCRRHVRWQVYSGTRAREFVEVTYTCPLCGYVEHDVID